MRVAAYAVLAVLFVVIVGVVLAFSSDVYRTRVTFVHEDSWDAHGVQHFQIKLPDGTRATVSVDGDVDFSRALMQRVNQPLMLSLEPAGLER